MPFRLPTLQKTEQNETRRVGFEFEFAGVDLEDSAAILLRLFGGRLIRRNKFLYEIEGSRYGRFAIELDASLLKTKAYETYLGKLGIQLSDFPFVRNVEDMIARVASTVVPYEIVSPPIPLPELQVIEELRTALLEQRAMGSKASLLYAFGLHLNPEAPSLRPEIIVNFLRAFLLLYDWIFKKSKIDLSRRLTPFINEFPKGYRQLVLSGTYHPGIDRLIDDYLAFNPTRNRPLDLLPLFAFIDEHKVLTGATEKHLIKKRPAFHYRLPNCLIDEPSWSIAREWDYWVEVEDLAANPDKIRKMSDDLLQTLNDPFGFLQESWPDRVERWLHS